MNGGRVSEGTESAVRVLRLVNSRRVHLIHEPVPFRPIRPVAPDSCEDRGSCVSHPQCAHRDCGNHPANPVDPKASALFWKVYLGLFCVCVLLAVGARLW